MFDDAAIVVDVAALVVDLGANDIALVRPSPRMGNAVGQ